MPEQPSRPTDDLERRLDALGRALVAERPAAPSTALLAAMNGRRARRVVVARAGGALALAAMLTLAAIAYAILHPRPSRSTIATGPSHTETSSPVALSASPTMAALRTLNQNTTPETLRFPKDASASASGPSMIIQPINAHDTRMISQLLGSER